MKAEKTAKPESRTKGKWFLGGGLAAAFVASLCCIGPLVAGSLGLGVFALAGFFAELRPVLLGVAGLLIGATWFWDWRRRRRDADGDEVNGAACQTGCHRRSRAGLIVVTLVALLFGSSPYLLEAWIQTTSGTETASVAGSEVPGLAVWNAELEGLYCPSCTRGLQRAFLDVEGVESARVTYDPQEAVVHYDPEKAAPEQLRKVVEEFGYGVVGDE